MEKCTVNTNTNIINERVEEVVRLYFSGLTVKEALKEVMVVEVLRKKLGKLIFEKNYDLIDPEVVRLSQRLDKHIVKEQRKKAAL